MKIVHLTSGSMNSGASKGAYILHKKLLANKINSFLINDDEILGKFTNTEFVNNNLLKKIRYRLIKNSLLDQIK